jgi:hypothetical protein
VPAHVAHPWKRLPSPRHIATLKPVEFVLLPSLAAAAGRGPAPHRAVRARRPARDRLPADGRRRSAPGPGRGQENRHAPSGSGQGCFPYFGRKSPLPAEMRKSIRAPSVRKCRTFRLVMRLRVPVENPHEPERTGSVTTRLGLHFAAATGPKVTPGDQGAGDFGDASREGLPGQQQPVRDPTNGPPAGAWTPGGLSSKGRMTGNPTSDGTSAFRAGLPTRQATASGSRCTSNRDEKLHEANPRPGLPGVQQRAGVSRGLGGISLPTGSAGPRPAGSCGRPSSRPGSRLPSRRRTASAAHRRPTRGRRGRAG